MRREKITPSSGLRQTDVVARFVGEEFLALLLGTDLADDRLYAAKHAGGNP